MDQKNNDDPNGYAGILKTIYVFLESLNLQNTCQELNNEAKSLNFPDIMTPDPRIVILHPQQMDRFAKLNQPKSENECFDACVLSCSVNDLKGSDALQKESVRITIEHTPAKGGCAGSHKTDVEQRNTALNGCGGPPTKELEERKKEKTALNSNADLSGSCTNCTDNKNSEKHTNNGFSSCSCNDTQEIIISTNHDNYRSNEEIPSCSTNRPAIEIIELQRSLRKNLSKISQSKTDADISCECFSSTDDAFISLAVANDCCTSDDSKDIGLEEFLYKPKKCSTKHKSHSKTEHLDKTKREDKCSKTVKTKKGENRCTSVPVRKKSNKKCAKAESAKCSKVAIDTASTPITCCTSEGVKLSIKVGPPIVQEYTKPMVFDCSINTDSPKVTQKSIETEPQVRRSNNSNKNIDISNKSSCGHNKTNLNSCQGNSSVDSAKETEPQVRHSNNSNKNTNISNKSSCGQNKTNLNSFQGNFSVDSAKETEPQVRHSNNSNKNTNISNKSSCGQNKTNLNSCQGNSSVDSAKDTQKAIEAESQVRLSNNSNKNTDISNRSSCRHKKNNLNRSADNSIVDSAKDTLMAIETQPQVRVSNNSNKNTDISNKSSCGQNKTNLNSCQGNSLDDSTKDTQKAIETEAQERISNNSNKNTDISNISSCGHNKTNLNSCQGNSLDDSTKDAQKAIETEPPVRLSNNSNKNSDTCCGNNKNNLNKSPDSSVNDRFIRISDATDIISYKSANKTPDISIKSADKTSYKLADTTYPKNSNILAVKASDFILNRTANKSPDNSNYSVGKSCYKPIENNSALPSNIHSDKASDIISNCSNATYQNKPILNIFNKSEREEVISNNISPKFSPESIRRSSIKDQKASIVHNTTNGRKYMGSLHNPISFDDNNSKPLPTEVLHKSKKRKSNDDDSPVPKKYRDDDLGTQPDKEQVIERIKRDSKDILEEKRKSHIPDFTNMSTDERNSTIRDMIIVAVSDAVKHIFPSETPINDPNDSTLIVQNSNDARESISINSSTIVISDTIDTAKTIRESTYSCKNRRLTAYSSAIQDTSIQNISDTQSGPKSQLSVKEPTKQTVAISNDFELDYVKIKKDLLESNIDTKLRLLQAIRWRLTKTNYNIRDHTLVCIIRNDLLFLYTVATPVAIGTFLESYYCPKKLATPHPLQTQMARLVNAIASMSVGRDYLAAETDLLRFVLLPLLMDRHPTGVCVLELTRDFIIATVQKLSLKAKIREMLIYSGLVKWLINFLSRNYISLSDYSLEYALALLMNLCLNSDARLICQVMSDSVLQLLLDLLKHSHTGYLPYLNSIIYNLLSDEIIRQAAIKANLAAEICVIMKESSGIIKKQLELILNVLSGETRAEPYDCDCDGVDDEMIDIMEPELDKYDDTFPEPTGEVLLSQYMLNIKPVESKDRLNALFDPVCVMKRKQCIQTCPVSVIVTPDIYETEQFGASSNANGDNILPKITNNATKFRSKSTSPLRIGRVDSRLPNINKLNTKKNHVGDKKYWKQESNKFLQKGTDTYYRRSMIMPRTPLGSSTDLDKFITNNENRFSCFNPYGACASRIECQCYGNIKKFVDNMTIPTLDQTSSEPMAEKHNNSPRVSKIKSSSMTSPNGINVNCLCDSTNSGAKNKCKCEAFQTRQRIRRTP